jgi:hypothetical protein
MNADIRRDFKELSGFDPKLLFDVTSSHYGPKAPGDLRRFLDYRARLASRMQTDWLDVVDQMHTDKPWLDVVLTHIDDQLEPNMRDALGADAAKSVPLIEAQHATVLVEDPATLWNLGSARYEKLASKWAELPLNPNKVAVDINVVERYQDVYPTKKQTGIELFELVHQAAVSFPRVALYFENSLERQDLDLLAAAACTSHVSDVAADEMSVQGSQPVRVLWSGPAEVDGKPWPVKSSTELIVPAGQHRVAVGVKEPAVHVLDFNGNLRNVSLDGSTVELGYKSDVRAILTVDPGASRIDLDGAEFWTRKQVMGEASVLLPRGEHLISIHP